jgi:nucleotide-binding universal stress UspA family protein
MPLSRVLVAVDFSPASLAAAQWVAHAVAPQADVVLLHAVDVPTPPSFLRSLFAKVEDVEQNAVPGATQRLEELKGSLGLQDAKIDVRTGKAFKALQDACAEHRSELVVIGPHGDRTGLGRLLGSTAERTVRESTRPVLIAGGAEFGRPKRIGVAVDDSPAGAKALAWAVRLANDLKAELVAVNVVDSLYANAVAVGSSTAEREKALAELTAESERWLEAQVADIKLAAGPVRTMVRRGHPADEVVNATREAECDLLVVGRNATGVTNTLGSIADFVMRANTSTTVVVPV